MGFDNSSISNFNALPESQFVRPFTFSSTKPNGNVSLTMRTNSNNSFPRSSSSPFRSPARLKLWQGGPPITRAASNGFNLAACKISSDVTSIMFLFITGTSGRFVFKVSQHDGSISTATAIEKPAFSKPISKPPAPENRLITRCFLGFGIILNLTYYFNNIINPTSQGGRNLCKAFH